MKQKELKNLAKQIAAIESKLSKTKDKKEQKQLQNAIIDLTNKAASDNIENLFIIDELVQQFLTKNNKNF